MEFENNRERSQDYLSYSGVSRPLPNATAVLVLGIVGLVFSCMYGFGFIMCIIGLVLANKDNKLYKASIGQYTEASYQNLKAGRIMSIIGLCISALMILVLIVYIIFVVYIIKNQGNFNSLFEMAA